jgi:hypothetical protein
MGEYTAWCVGGLFDRQRWTSRFPKGFMVVNRPAGEIVIYDAVDGAWVAREENGSWKLPEISDENAPKNRWRAALEPNYDVVAYDPERMRPWA